MVTSMEYWRKREEKHIQQLIKDDKKMQQEIAKRFQGSIDNINKEIDANWQRFSTKSGVSLSEAKRMSMEHDVKAFARKAKKYVEELDFSDKANKELRLYNVTMRVNRLELLKSQIGLELIALSDDIDKYTADLLTKEGIAEAKRQAGILGETVFDNYKDYVESVVNSSFQSATFSERIWGNLEYLKSSLDRLLVRAVTQGKNPKDIARELRNLFGSSKYDAERLIRTESARVQTAIQEKSYSEYEVESYQYIAEPTACKLCLPLNGKVFQTADMQIGKNASPMHANCRCSTAPYIDRDAIEAEQRARIGNSAKMSYNKGEGLFNGKIIDHKLSREKAVKLLSDEFGMKISETARTRLSDLALNQTYGVLKAFEPLYNALPQKIPLLRAIPKSKAKDAIAWYSRSGSDSTPIEFGINVNFFKTDDMLKGVVNRCVDNGWFSKNSNPNHIMVHEFGHHIDFQLSKLQSGSFSETVIRNMIKAHGNKYDRITIAKEIGGYASSYFNQTGKHSESFAEIFAEAYGETPREIALDFRAEFEKLAEDVVKNADGSKRV